MSPGCCIISGQCKIRRQAPDPTLLVQGATDDVRTWRDEWGMAQRRLDKAAARQTLTASLPVPEGPLQAHGKELLRIMHSVKAKRLQVHHAIGLLLLAQSVHVPCTALCSAAACTTRAWEEASWQQTRKS